MTKKKQEAQRIDVSSDDITQHNKHNKINALDKKSIKYPTPHQSELFHIDTQVEYEDIEMGVLENGVAYLSERGLSRLCGIDNSTLHELSSSWDEQKLKPRGRAIDQLLRSAGFEFPELFIKAEFKGKEVNAYTEPVCMALLEYYAFEASDKKEQAQRAFRRLAREGLRQFVYAATGYKPEQKALDSWKHFYDRTDMTMDAAPFGYFGVFREIAIMIVPMIRAGIIINDKVIPDISVGKAWSEYWKANELSEQFGDRAKYDHEYPDYYPQSKSNPQPSYCYPNGALGKFREWLQTNYIVNRFPKYLLGRTKEGKLPYETANKAVQAFGGKSFPEQKNKLIK